MFIPPPIRLTPTQIAVIGAIALGGIAIMLALAATMIEMQCGPFCGLHMLEYMR